MKKRIKKSLSLVVALMFTMAFLVACGGEAASSSAPAAEPSSTAVSEASSMPASSAPASSMPASQVGGDGMTLNIAGLKGPTTMGMVKLMSDAAAGETAYDYNVEMQGAPDAIVPLLVSGEVDIAAIPANLASTIYNNTSGQIQTAAINTLGVLYVVETGETIQSIEDLRGRTIYSTGKGTTPEFVLNHILTQNGIDPASDVTIEYKTEATEVAALLGEATDAVAVLPQPYVTTVQAQNDAVRVALDLTEEWDNVSESSLVTGVLVVRKDFLEDEANAAAFEAFLADYEASINWVNENVADAAQLVAEYEIVPDAALAERAIPECNIVYVAGQEMQTALSGYLQVLYDQMPESVGGAMPAEDFYLM